ncbi:MAG TPA: JAB domain-containing protein [Niabella sp.]|nr:JAB domain-containing protein [Bacteroidia bacterium]HRB52074.1 JAB domain-containing protein [Bacteroidia bacterium]HRC03089.1 JAB domain-containing protein [Niabella sp.]
MQYLAEEPRTYLKNLPEFSIKYKKGQVKEVKIINAQTAYELLKELYDADTLEYCESSIVIFLNRNNRSIGWFKVSQGGISGTVVDNRMILATALTAGASSIIMSHNHPSGNINPSDIDDKLTSKLKQACDILDIKLLDHIIVTADDYYSYGEQGKI